MCNYQWADEWIWDKLGVDEIRWDYIKYGLSEDLGGVRWMDSVGRRWGGGGLEPGRLVE